MLNHWVTCESVVSLSRTVQSWDVISSCNWHFNNLGGNHHQSSDDDFHSDCWKVSHLTLIIISTQVVERSKGCWKVKRLLKGQKVSYLTLIMTSAQIVQKSATWLWWWLPESTISVTTSQFQIWTEFKIKRELNKKFFLILENI